MDWDDAVAATLRSQRPTYDDCPGSDLNAPVDTLPRAMRWQQVSASRAAPVELRGDFYEVHILRVGREDDASSALAECSFTGREFRDAVPVVAGSVLRFPRGCRALWLRPGRSDTYSDTQAQSVELAIVQVPAVELATQAAVVTCERPAAVVADLLSAWSLTTLQTYAPPLRCAYRVRAVAHVYYDGTPMVMPPGGARVQLVAYLASSSPQLLDSDSSGFVSGVPASRRVVLDTVVPVLPSMPGSGLSWASDFRLGWDSIPNHGVIASALIAHPHPLASAYA